MIDIIYNQLQKFVTNLKSLEDVKPTNDTVVSLGLETKDFSVFQNQIFEAVGIAPISTIDLSPFFQQSSLELLSQLLITIKQVNQKPGVNPKYENLIQIAVVGIGLRLPGGINTLDKYWDVLVNGKFCISPTSTNRHLHHYMTDAKDLKPGEHYVSKFCLYDSTPDAAPITDFDPLFFNMNPGEATALDPKFRWLLETTYEAFQDAGIDPDTISNSNTNIYCAPGQVNQMHTYTTDASPTGFSVLTGQSMHCCSAASMPGRLSFMYNLYGAAHTVDTACSSGLVATHDAFKDLNLGETDLAIVNAAHCPFLASGFSLLSTAQMVSRNCRCAAYDEGADGYVPGEGCVTIILKRKDDAIRDHNKIYGLINATTVGQSGSRPSMSAPSVEGQTKIHEEILKLSHLKPKDIDYMEGHGTGTSLGDRTEGEAINKIFKGSHTKERPLTLASVKTNIGHTEEVSGLSSLVKVLLAMKHKTIPPHLHFQHPSPLIDFESVPLHIPTQPEEWKPAEGKKRVALVSSFGLSGSVSDAIVEEYIDNEATNDIYPINDTYHILTISAKNNAALIAVAKQYITLLESLDAKAPIADLCYTSNVGRQHMNYRYAVSGRTADELATKLRQYVEQGKKATRSDKTDVGMSFTGQGSIKSGVGQELYNAQPVFRQAIDKCDAVIKRVTGISLIDALYNPQQAHQLEKAQIAQPALFAYEYAMCMLWKSWGIEPTIVNGHSLGEIVAAAVTGAIDIDLAIDFIVERARCMGEYGEKPGAMVSVFEKEEVVKKTIEEFDNEEEVAIAALNGVSHTVISGYEEEVDDITEYFNENNIKTKKLNVTDAFHSPLMDPAIEELNKWINKVDDEKFRQSLKVKFISNVDGKIKNIGERLDKDYWGKHARSAVRFIDGVKSMIESEKKLLAMIEVGPAATLSHMSARYVRENDTLRGKGPTFIPSSSADQNSEQYLYDAVSNFYMIGGNINWKAFHQGRVDPTTSKKIPNHLYDLPLYPFQRSRYWLETEEQMKQPISKGNATWDLYKAITVIQGNEEGEIIVSAPLTPQYVKYLCKNHVIGENGCVPAAAYTEFIFSAMKAIHHNTNEVIEICDELLIRSPLNIEETSDVVFIMKKTGDTFAVYGKVDDGVENHMLNGSACLLKDGENANIMKTLPSKEEMKSFITKYLNDKTIKSGQIIYDTINQHSFYGGGFPSVKGFIVGEDEKGKFLISRLDSKDKSINNSRSGLSQVYLFDASLHSNAGRNALENLEGSDKKSKGIDNVNEAFLPSSFENIIKFKPTPDECYVVHRYVEGTDENSNFTTFSIYDLNGEIVEYVNAFQSRRIKLRTSQNTPEFETYDFNFIPVEKPFKDINVNPYFYILSDNSGYADAFINAMKAKEASDSSFQFRYLKVDFPTKESCNEENLVKDFKSLGLQTSDMEKEVLAIVNFMAMDLKHLNPKLIDYNGTEFKELLRHAYEDNLVFIQTYTRVIDMYDIQRTFCFVTKNATDYWESDIDLIQGIVSGINKGFWREFTDTRIFELDNHEEASPAEVAERVFTEVTSSVDRYEVTREVIYGKDGKRYENQIKKVIAPGINYSGEGSIQYSGTILITGGLGGVGFDVTKHLIQQPNLKAVVLTGRRPETDEKVAEKLNELRSQSKQVKILYTTANVNSMQDMKKVIQDINSSEDRPLFGVIHSAGTNDDGLIFNQSYERFLKLVSSKIEGSLNIARITEGLNLKFTILLSSMTAFFGNRGQINYGTANMFINKVCRIFRSQGRKDIISLQLAGWPSGLSSIIKDNTFHFNEINSINLFSNLMSCADELPGSFLGTPVVNWKGVFDYTVCDPMFRPVRPSDRPKLDWKTANDSTYIKNEGESKETGSRAGSKKFNKQEVTNENVFEVMEHELKKILQYGENDEIDPYQSLTELGIDSIMIMELRTILRNVIGINIPLVIFSSQNINLYRLVDYVKSKMGSNKEEADDNEETEEEKRVKADKEQKEKEEEAKLISNDQVDQWIVPIPGSEEVEDPSNVFIFFPSADEGEVDYSEYVDKMEDSLLFKIELPGYGKRKNESLMTDWNLLIKNISKAIIQTDVSGKFKECKTIHFIGNSFGAIVAWKTLLQIQVYEDDGKEVPIISTLIITRAIAPSVKRPIELGGQVISELSNEGIAEFLQSTGSKTDFSGELSYLLPVIHNEYVMNDSVTNDDNLKINSKLLILTGKQDKIIDDNNTLLWKKEVNDDFSEFTQHIKMRGNHWFIEKDTSKYLKNIMDNLD